jgi:hypothetical protein
MCDTCQTTGDNIYLQYCCHVTCRPCYAIKKQCAICGTGNAAEEDLMPKCAPPTSFECAAIALLKSILTNPQLEEFHTQAQTGINTAISMLTTMNRADDCLSSETEGSHAHNQAVWFSERCYRKLIYIEICAKAVLALTDLEKSNREKINFKEAIHPNMIRAKDDMVLFYTEKKHHNPFYKKRFWT